MSDSDDCAFGIGIAMGMTIGLIIVSISTFSPDTSVSYNRDGYLSISNSTGNDICHQITNNSVSTASAENGKLICLLPSYDHTQNIIVKENNK